MQRAICSWHKAQPGRLWQREAHKAGGSIRLHATLAKVAMAAAPTAPELQSCAALVGNISGRKGREQGGGRGTTTLCYLQPQRIDGFVDVFCRRMTTQSMRRRRLRRRLYRLLFTDDHRFGLHLIAAEQHHQ